MIHSYTDPVSDGVIRLILDDANLQRTIRKGPETNTLLIAWNRGKTQRVQLDDTIVTLQKEDVMVINNHQPFRFERSEDIIAWEFNREFYCIIDHDAEVSCAGLLFYNHQEAPVISLDDTNKERLELLVKVFEDEYMEEADNLKTEMLRTILKRLIVKLTRTYKSQQDLTAMDSSELHIIRQFNLLVEQHFRKFHQVQEYADLLHKSPKTISNLFAVHSSQTPLEVIHARIVVEGKRLLTFTNHTAKEIGYELGFSELQAFSRFFKKHTGFSPMTYRKMNHHAQVGTN